MTALRKPIINKQTGLMHANVFTFYIIFTLIYFICECYFLQFRLLVGIFMSNNMCQVHVLKKTVTIFSVSTFI